MCVCVFVCVCARASVPSPFSWSGPAMGSIDWAGRLINRPTHRWAGRPTDRPPDGRTDRPTGRPTDPPTGRPTHRSPDDQPPKQHQTPMPEMLAKHRCRRGGIGRMCRFAYARLHFLSVITPPFGGVIIGKALITPPSGPTRAGNFGKLHVLGTRAWPPKPRRNIKIQKLFRRMSHQK